MSVASPHPVAEAMEDRILHSADIAPLVLAGAGADSLLQQPVHAAAAATAQQSQRNEIVFVDAALPDAASLLADLQAQRSAGRPIDIVTIAADEDGLALITRTLADRQDITAVHVLAHGSDGALQLGSMRLDAQTLLQRAGDVAAWGGSLAADADLLLYGCDLAQTAIGQRLVDDIAALTGADVAASTDLTGAASLGGNWTLEYAHGRIEAALAPSFAEQSAWRGVLATYTVTSTSDLFIGFISQTGTLRWAIGQANSNPGTDTIVFAVNGTFSNDSLFNGGDDNSTGDLDVLGSVNIVGNGTGNTIIQGDSNDRVLDLRSGTINLSGMTIRGGTASQGAGIQVLASANVTLTDVIVQNNYGSGASKGAGIYNAGALTLRNVIVQNNGNTAADTEGAGIYLDKDASLDALNVEIRGNIADNKNGGGLFIKDDNTTRLENVTFAGNNAKDGGGMFLTKKGGSTLLNVTFSGNVATGRGGGLFTEDDVTLDHVTVAYNSATTGGGVFDNKGGGITITNSLFANNTGGNTNRALTSLGYNLSDDNSAGFTGTGDLKNTAASLSPLASNGGFTRTHAISLTSAARDAANPVTTLTKDQRGVSYFGGRADIGAYEQNPFGFAPTVSAIAGQSVNEDTALGPIAFTVADFETSAGSLVVTATSSNTALVPNGSIVIGGSGANRTVTLTPAANANSSINGGPATITLSVTDGGNTVTTTFTVTVLAVNDAPTIALPGAQTLAEDGSLTLSGASAPVIADVDAGSASVQLTLAVTHGLLSLSQTTGLSFVTGNGVNNASMTLSGSLSAINAALSGLQYRPTANYNGPDQLSLTVNDLGNTGSGGARTTVANLGITVTAVNDAPTFGLPGAQVTPQLSSLAFSSGNGNAITLSDLDAGSAAIELTLSTLAGGNGRVSFGSLTGLTLVSGTGSNDTTVVLRGSQSNLNAALNTLSFLATASGAASIDVSVNDLGNTGSGGALQSSGTVSITVDNEAPPVLALSRTTLTFTENGAAAVLDPGLTVADTDNTTLAAANIHFTAGYAGVQDELRFTANPATMGNITASYSAGVLSLNSAGATATLAQWQAALRSVAYANLSDSPDTTTRTLALTINDGIADSAARGFTINVVSINDAPVLAGANDMATIAEDEASNFGTQVSTLIAGHVSDADAAAMSGIAVVAVDNTHGAWQYSTNGGGSWAAFGAVSNTAARLLGADAATLVRFVPNTDWNGSVVNGLTFRAWDQTSGSAGGTASASSNGGTTAFSSGTGSSSITVAAVNDAPVLAGANSLTTIAEDASGNPGTLVSALVAGHTSDVDAGAVSGIAVTGADSAFGTWQYTTDGGATWLALGGVSSNAARLLAADALTAVRLVPTSNLNGTTAAGLTFRAWDQTSGSAGGLADASLSGGTTAFSNTSASSAITVTPVNDAPTLANTIIDQTAAQDAAFSFAVPPDTFDDVDQGDTLVYSATLSSGAALPAWLTFNAGAATFSGVPGNADVGSIVVRVTATDGASTSAFGDFTLNVTNTNDAPTVATAIPDQTAAQGTAFSFAFSAGTFADVDVGDTLAYAATLPGGGALPSWLNFNAATRTFGGTPGNADVGSLTVRVTATDGSSASVTDDFVIVVANLNDAPTLASPLPDQATAQGAAFVFTVGAGAFADVDAGDTLVYSAALSGGGALPAWLNFDAATRTFSGTPGNADVGAISIRVTATDGSAASVSDDFALAVANRNDAPTVAVPLADQSATQDTPFSASFALGSFADIDVGDTLRFSATLASGAALPSWLSFDAATRTFSGTPANADVGAVLIRVVATDTGNASVASDFVLSVANINDAPVLTGALAPVEAPTGAAFSFRLPVGAFVDPDVGDTLRYSATLANGAALPAWLAFDPATGNFTGDPRDGDVGRISVRVTATDAAGLSAQGVFALTVSIPVAEAPVPTAGLPVAETPAVPEAAAPLVQAAAQPAAATVVVASAAGGASAQPASELTAASLPEAAAPGQSLIFAVDNAPLAEPARADASGSTSASALASRSDAVLSEVVVAQLNQLSASPMNQLMRGDELTRRFEEMQRQMQQQGETRGATIASSILVTSGVSIGYVVWLVRGGVLMSSMLSALPAWQMVDPLPVLAASRAGKGKTGDGDDGDVDRLFDKKAPKGVPPSAPSSPPVRSGVPPSEGGP